ncbi:MAG TPA: hypothetical protein VK196_02720 [Magnetospirillum sp.]|nr:hypothetical protein [Magnetospirillum sp.]
MIAPSALLDLAEADAAQAPSPLLKARAFATVALHAAALANEVRTLRCLGQAEHVLPKLRLPDRVFVLDLLVKGALKLGRGDLAERLALDAAAMAGRVRTTALRGLVLAKAAHLLALVGKAEEALVLIGRMDTGSDLVRRDVVRACLNLGDLDQAIDVASRITGAEWRGECLGRVAVALFDQGQVERGQAVLDMIEGPGWRAMALSEAASALALNAF